MAESVRVAAKSLPVDRCPYCHDAIGDEPSRTCPECGVCLHWECWQESETCPTLGCEVRSDSFTAPQHPGLKLSVRERVEDVAATVAGILSGSRGQSRADEGYSAYLECRGREELGRRRASAAAMANLGCLLSAVGLVGAILVREGFSRAGLVFLAILFFGLYLLSRPGPDKPGKA